MIKKTLWIVLAGCLLAPAAVIGQSASDISVPAGFRVEKVLESNKIADPQGIAVLPSGDILVALMTWQIDKITPTGEVSTFAKVKINRGPGPFDIVATPAGTVFFTSNDLLGDPGPGLYRVDNGQAVLVTPPGWRLWYLTQDDAGNFYAQGGKPGVFSGIVKITDSDGDGQFDVAPCVQLSGCTGLAYRNGSLYTLQKGNNDNTGIIRRFTLSGGDGSIIVSNLNQPSDLAVDGAGNFYTQEYIEDRAEGLGIWSYFHIIKILPDNSKEIVHPDFLGGYLAVGLDNTLYISDFNRARIFKVVNGVETLLTEDTGLNASAFAFDLDNRGYFSSFRYAQLKRFNPDTGAVENVTEPLGMSNQTLAVDSGGKIYLSSQSPSAVYRFDPSTSSVEKLASLWTRTLRFDSFNRLAVTKSTIQGGTTQDDWISTIGLLDMNTQQITSYITGVRNTERGFLFDKDQNFYVKLKRGDGIIKVQVPRDPTNPPFDVGQELFYDLRVKDSEIRFFTMNSQGQLLIPLSDTGDVVLDETNGSWHDFASGFRWPAHVSFDRNGVMYVGDSMNAVFRIIGKDFIVPTVNERLTGLDQDIRAKVSDKGIANSLCTKIQNAISSLSRGNINAGMNQIEAFIKDVSTQSGKKIAVDNADAFIKLARQILDGLKLL